jgi:hypothetical protein
MAGNEQLVIRGVLQDLFNVGTDLAEGINITAVQQ